MSMPAVFPLLRSRLRSQLATFHFGHLLAVWLVVRIIVWLALIVVSHPNAPLDLVEWLSWGHSLEWGYPKHPPLPAWLAVAFAHLSPGDVWGVYVLSYLTTAGCLLAAWRLAREYLPPAESFLATVCLDGLMFLTNDGAEWSNNVALDLGWAWIIVFAHRAIRTDSTRAWVAVGLTTGLTLLCKYTIGVLLLPLAVFILANPDARRCLRRPGPYLAVLIAATVFVPHLLWLVRNDFITLAYAAERSSDTGGILDHVKNPLLFLLGQSYLIAPLLFVLVPALGTRSRSDGNGFLHATFLGPIALLFALSILTGCQLRQIWGSPLWTFLGVCLLAVFSINREPSGVQRALRRAVWVAVAMMLFVVVKQFAGPYLAPKPDRQHYPGRLLAEEANQRWNALYSCPLPIVAGEGWGAGNVCIYSPQRPILYSNGEMANLAFDSKVCSWTSDEDLNRRGGAIVWDAYRYGDDVPSFLKERLPRVVGQPPVVLPFQTGAPIAPVRIGLAFVPPTR